MEHPWHTAGHGHHVARTDARACPYMRQLYSHPIAAAYIYFGHDVLDKHVTGMHRSTFIPRSLLRFVMVYIAVYAFYRRWCKGLKADVGLAGVPHVF